MKKYLLTLVLSTLFLALTAQDVDRDRRIMEKVIAAGDKYSYASFSHDTLEVAKKNAVAQLASQIITDVRVKAKTEIHSVTGNGEVDEKLFFDQVAETFTNVRMEDYHTLIVAIPDRKNSNYTAFVYIEKESISKIYARIEAEEQEAKLAKSKRINEDVKYYYNKGEAEMKGFRVGDALKSWYWAYALSIGTDINIGNEPAARFLETKIDELLSNIQVTAVACKPEKINDLQEKYNVILDISYMDSTSVLHKVTNLDFIYNNGQTMVDAPRVKDGVGTLELQYDLDEVRLYCVYNYESETPEDVRDNVKSKETKKFASANKVVKITKEAKRTKDVVVDQSEVELPVTRAFADSVAVTSESKQEFLLQQMVCIEKAIREKNYASVQSLFTEEGYKSFEKLVKYGNASIVGKPQYSFLDFGSRTLCRSITMRFRFKNNKQFIENVTFRFDTNNLVESLAFTLSDVAENDILKKGDWRPSSRLTLLTFLEDYQTAYALGDIDYLNKVFSDKALIIVGHKLEEKVLPDGVRVMGRVDYETLSKEQYITRLKGHFASKEFINLNFTETDFRRATNNQEMYGLRVRQEYNSSNYCDVGYLFLLVDFRFELPIIHVRAWQNDKLPIESLVELNDYY